MCILLKATVILHGKAKMVRYLNKTLDLTCYVGGPEVNIIWLPSIILQGC